MSNKQFGDRVAELLLRCKAVNVGRGHPYMLAGGWASPVYVDVRLLISEPSTRKAITEIACDYLTSESSMNFDVIVGGESAGIPFATLVAERLNKPLRFVRKKPLGIGRNAQVEGGSVEGMKALLVDDLTTDGMSKASFVRGLGTAGAIVADVLSIFFYDVFRSRQAAEPLRYRLLPIATWADVLRNATPSHLAADDRLEIEKFLADPEGWSAWHGGRSSSQNEIR